MIYEFDTSKIRWEMDWSETKPDGTRMYPNSPEKEMVFEPERALAYLLLKNVVFINDHWWKKDWPQEAKDSMSVNVDCSDVFAWASADAEPMYYDDLEDLFEHYEKDPMWGPAVWCIKRRRQLPQKPVYTLIQHAKIWDLDQLSKEWNDDKEIHDHPSTV